MNRFVSVGECMVELSPAGQDLWRTGIAGDTLNTAWYARAVLPDDWAVSYVTRIGRDAFSDQALDFMAANGIDTQFIARHQTRSIGLYAISLHNGERSFAYWRDTSAARTLAEAEAPLLRAISEAGHVHVSGITLAILPPEGRDLLLSALAERRRCNLSSSLDPNFRPQLWPSPDTARAALAAAARVCNIVLPSFDDEAALFGDADPVQTARRYAVCGATTVVVKNGGGPVPVIEAGTLQIIDDLPTVQPVDTTGAGDSFNAGLLAARLLGAEIGQAVRAAHALACRVIRHRGALIPMHEI